MTRAHSERPGPAPAPAARVRAYYRHVDAGDVDALLELFAEDCIYERPGYAPLVGKAALAHFYATVRVIESGRHELGAVIGRGDTVAVEGRWSGRLRNGSDAEVRFAEFFVFSDDLIARRRTYFYAAAV